MSKEKKEVKEQTPQEIKLAEIEAKCVELAAKNGCFKVHPIIFISPVTKEIDAVGYVKEPPLQAKMAMLDMALQAPFSCAESVYDAYVIKEESDPRLWNKQPENDAFYLGGLKVASDIVQMYSNQFKKKSN